MLYKKIHRQFLQSLKGKNLRIIMDCTTFNIIEADIVIQSCYFVRYCKYSYAIYARSKSGDPEIILILHSGQFNRNYVIQKIS